MSLFATIERDAPEADKLVTLAHLAADYQEKVRERPDKGLSIFIYGYLTAWAAQDMVKEEIERDLMNRSVGSMSKTLVQMGVPVDKLYIGEYVFSSGKGRKIDLFLEQQGEARHYLPGNPSDGGHKVPMVDKPKPAQDTGLTVTSEREIVVEVTSYRIGGGSRTLIPELTLKKTTGISPVEISKGYNAELTVLKPKIEAVLRKIGQEGLADKIEFSVKIVGGAKLSKEFAGQLSTEIAASLRAVLDFTITVPGTRRELPVELSYSYGAFYNNGTIADEGTGMIKVTLLKFKGL